MSKKDSTSKFLSLILRHKPETIGIKLDVNGWAYVDELIKQMSKRDVSFDMKVLEDIVTTDDKKRYSFNEDKTKIRANQGHSVKVNVSLKEMIPPNTLYHGTATRFMNSIKEKGILPGSRLYVHLSDDYKTAIKVGKRHGEPTVLLIDTKRMREDGYKFYLSENNVWLVEEVPFKYVNILNERGRNMENETIGI